MRPPARGARTVRTAVALAVAFPIMALADAPASVATCVDYGQAERDGGLDVTLDNRCDVGVRCTVRWTLVCAPGVSKRRKRSSAASVVEIAPGTSGAIEARAACGHDAWEIKDVRWVCEPAP